MQPISIGILSWKAPQTLRHTLESYSKSGLFDLVSQIFIFFQEISDVDRGIAEEYSIEAFGVPKNIGIANGYNYMLDKIKYPYYLFLENDWMINDNEMEFVKERLDQGINLLDSGIDFIKYRSRLYPGSPLWARRWFGYESYHPEHILDSLHWRTDESINRNFSEELTSIENGWYITKSRYANWTNNPHLVKTDWLFNAIKPKIGRKDIERDIQKWWRSQDFNVAQGHGLFTHLRLDR